MKKLFLMMALLMSVAGSAMAQTSEESKEKEKTPPPTVFEILEGTSVEKSGVASGLFTCGLELNNDLVVIANRTVEGVNIWVTDAQGSTVYSTSASLVAGMYVSTSTYDWEPGNYTLYIGLPDGTVLYGYFCL